MSGHLNKIFVGQPITIGEQGAKDPMERLWESGIFKEEVEVPVFVGFTNIEGDGQADLKHHGGPEKAVFVYPSEHYLYWNKHVQEVKMHAGGMGENFSTVELSEDGVCIGDTYEIGEAVVQVSQPRQPCWKPARRFKQKNLALLIQNSGRTGWYFRVLKEGQVKKGQTFRLIERPFPEWTIATCNSIMHEDKKNIELARKLANCPLLAPNWRETLHNRVEKGIESDIKKRVFGPNQ